MRLKVFSGFAFRKRITPFGVHCFEYIDRHLKLYQADADLKRVRLIAKTNVPALHEQVKFLLERE